MSNQFFLTRHTQVYTAGQVRYTQQQVSDLSKPSAATGKLSATGNLLSDATEYAFALEANANGTPVPVVTKEVDMAAAGPSLLTKHDFTKTEVVKANVYTIVDPASDYWKETMEG